MMAVNIQVNAGDVPVELYFQDGEQSTVEANSSDSIQLVDGGFCTIAETTVIEGKEEAKGHSFIEIMVKFWQKMLGKVAAPQRRDYKKESENG